MTLSTDQQAAADAVLKFLIDTEQKEMVVEGYPGCGKSFLTKYLITAIQSSSKLIHLLTNIEGNIDIHCTATTNKAAAVLQSFAEQKATTIHNLLGLKVTNNYSTGKTSLRKTGNYQVVEDSLVIIDEASYIDKHLLKLIRESTHNCKVLYVGDRYQLTAIHETVCPVFTQITDRAVLTGSERFEKDGAIATLGAQFRHAIDTGIFPKLLDKDSTGVIQRISGAEFKQLVNTEFSQRDLPDNHAKVLAWSNAKVRQYNDHIRKLYTDSQEFLIGERVVTNKPIFYQKPRSKFKKTMYSTEAMATVTGIKEGEEFNIKGWWIILDYKTRVFQPREQWMVKSYIKELTIKAKQTGDWTTYFNVIEFFGDLRAIHAATVYKAQGSTYDTVFVDLNDIGKCNQPNVVARMLHVAVTRAAKKLYLYGELPHKYSGV